MFGRMFERFQPASMDEGPSSPSVHSQRQRRHHLDLRLQLVDLWMGSVGIPWWRCRTGWASDGPQPRATEFLRSRIFVTGERPSPSETRRTRQVGPVWGAGARMGAETSSCSSWSVRRTRAGSIDGKSMVGAVARDSFMSRDGLAHAAGVAAVRGLRGGEILDVAIW